MAENRICPDCGGEMPLDTLGGHCPRCLARIVFGAPGDPSPDAAPLPEGSEAAAHGQESRKESAADTAESDLSGQRVGRYKLLEKIGEGGFGIVYMAEQLEPVQRRVALKLIKPGMDSRAIIARFEAERQALALMDHPNIARFYDAGVADAGLSSPEVPTTKPPPPAALYGRPYFVMELVRGTALTDYCDQQQLPTRARLELFIQVCQAVQHAHQKGIIHRDLKPSNVLVSLHDPGTPGVPKIIDFGIAKALDQKLTDKTLFTGFAQLLGTPAYMSPEQAEFSGLDVDTRSDIYSLGVLLYELLTGVTPFDQPTLAKAALDEIRRLIRETDPPRPSTRVQTLGGKAAQIALRRQTDPAALRRSLSGDLDWIVMKTLEKDRSRRYATANGLAADLQRYLNNEPVVARPPSSAYRFHKLVLRHRVAVAATGAVALALVLGLGLATWFFFRERSAWQSEKRVAELLKEMLAGVTPREAKGQDTALLELMLDKAARQVVLELTNEPAVLADLQTHIGQVYWAVGQYPKAETNLASAVALRRRMQPKSLDLAESLDGLSQPLWYEGRLGEAEQAQREALAIRTRRLPRHTQLVATSLNNLGVILGEEQKLDEAQDRLEEALAIQQVLPQKDPGRLAETLCALSSIYWKQRRFKKAEDLDRQALAIYRNIRDELDPDAAQTLNNLGTVLREEGNFEEAIQAHRKALEIQKKLFKHEHPDLAVSLHNLAKVLWETGANQEAEAAYRELRDLWIRLAGPEDWRVAVALNNLGSVLSNEGKLTDAEAAFDQALTLEKKLNRTNDIACSLNNLATVRLLQKRVAEAEPLLAEAVACLKNLPYQEEALATALRSHAVALRDLGRMEQAEKTIRECLSLCENDPNLKDNWRKFDAMSVLGGLLVTQRNFLAAEPLLLSGNEGLRQRVEQIPVANRPRVRQTFERLIALYETWDKPEEAAKWKQKLAESEMPQPPK